MIEIKELRLKCACEEPFHFVHFCYSIDPEGVVDFFQIEFQTYEGSIWKRLKKAVEIIFSGWVKGEADWSCIDRKRIEELRDFCNKCLAESAPKEGEPRP
jgi:hypothetical protein